MGGLTNDTLAATTDDVTDEADLLGLLGVELAASEGELARLGSVTDDLGEALEGANIGSQSDLDLLELSAVAETRSSPTAHQNTHGRVLGTEANVACRRNVDGKADGDSVDSADHRLASLLERGDGGLEALG